MKIIAFALFCVLFGSFGNYPPPAEETHTRFTQNSGRPAFARRDQHRAIRYKSVHAPDPAHFGLSAAIPGRTDSFVTSPWFIASPADSVLLLSVSSPLPLSPRSVSPQTETEPKAIATDTTILSADEICLSSEEKKLYDLIMAYRKSKRLPAIPYSARLSKVAQTHVRDLEENYDYGNSDNCNPHSWSGKGTWTSCCYTSDHKKASCMWAKPKEVAGYEGYGYEIAYYSSAGANATEGLEGWKKSQGHNPLLVNLGTWSKVKWQAIGIGIYGQYGVVWFGEELDESKMKVCK